MKMPDVLNIEVKAMNIKVGRYELISDGTYITKVFCDGIEQKGITRVVIDIAAGEIPKIIMFMLPRPPEND